MYLRTSLSRRKGRTVFLVIAVALAIALSVTLLSFGEGMRHGYVQLLDDRGTDIYIGGMGSNPLFGGMNVIRNGTEIAADISEKDGVRSSVPIFSGYRPFFAVNESMWDQRNESGIQNIALFGVVAGLASEFVGEDQALINGTGLETPGDPLYGKGSYDGVFTGEIVVSEDIALFLGVSIGDNMYINSFLPSAQNVDSWMENVTRMTVTDIRNIGGRRAVIHISELREMSGLSGSEVTEIRVDLYDPLDANRIAEEIREEHGVAAFTVDDLAGQSDRFLSSFKGIASVLSAVAVVIAGVFVATIMDISVQERKRELGLLRAIGFGSRTMFLNMMFHSFLIVGVGCLLGIAMGWIATGYIELLLSARFRVVLPGDISFSRITGYVLIVSAAMATLVSIISGLVAFRRVMSIHVVEVLHGD